MEVFIFEILSTRTGTVDHENTKQIIEIHNRDIGQLKSKNSNFNGKSFSKPRRQKTGN